LPHRVRDCQVNSVGDAPRKRVAEVVLRHRPVERHLLARPFLQRLAVGGDRLLQPHRPARAFPEPHKRVAEVVLRVIDDGRGITELRAGEFLTKPCPKSKQSDRTAKLPIQEGRAPEKARRSMLEAT
jgi:hypothetical protein